jgi:hypothetical protein
VTYRLGRGGDLPGVASVSNDAVALVIRIWREPGVPGFRGRIMSTADEDDPGVVVRNSDQVHAVVQEWIDRFVQDPAEHGEDETR